MEFLLISITDKDLVHKGIDNPNDFGAEADENILSNKREENIETVSLYEFASGSRGCF